MELKVLLTADTVNISREGKINIAGEFNSFHFGKMPGSWPLMSIFARFEAHLGEGLEHALQIKVTDQDGAAVLQSPVVEMKFKKLGSGIPARADVIAQLAGITFPRYGDYTVHLFVDGVRRGDTTLYVRQRPPTTPALPLKP